MKGLAHKMKTIGSLIGMALLCSCAVSCRTSATPLPISTPQGFIAVTAQQKALVAGLHRLTLGMTAAEVRTQLGNAAEEKPGLFFYHLAEDASGGHYVTARLLFGQDKLTKVELGFGHIDRVPE